MQRSTRVKILLVLAAITVLVRLPFFFHDVIDPDESTFILMGQDIVDGNLPYDKQWDLKPPLLFYAFAATIAVFGKSIPAIRLTGLLCVLAASSLIFLCAEKLRGPRTGFIAAFLFIVTSTFSEAGAGTVSEIIAVVPLAAAMLVLLKEQVRARDFFLAGFFISLACLVRLNLGYLALAGGLLLLGGWFVRPRDGLLARVCSYVAGGAVPLVLIFLPYVIAGKERLFTTAMIYAPLSYAGSQMSLVEAAHKYTCSAFEPCCLLLGFPVLASLACGVPIYFFRVKNIQDPAKSFIAMIAVFGGATAVSILKSGPAFGHYIIQLLPFAALLSAFLIDRLLDTRWKPLVLLLSLMYLIFPIQQIAMACRPVLARAMAGKRLVYGSSYEIADYLRTANPGDKPVFFMGAQLAEWFLGLKPIAREVANPSLIGREYVMKALDGPSATTCSVLAAILDRKPEFIVKPAVVSYLIGHQEASKLLSRDLFANYEPVREIDEFVIYRRCSSVVSSCELERQRKLRSKR